MNSATNVRSFWVVFSHHIVFQRMCHETMVSCKSCITSRVVYTMWREKNQQRPAAMTKTATNNMKHRPKVRCRSITATLRIRRDGRGNWSDGKYFQTGSRKSQCIPGQIPSDREPWSLLSTLITTPWFVMVSRRINSKQCISLVQIQMNDITRQWCMSEMENTPEITNLENALR